MLTMTGWMNCKTCCIPIAYEATCPNCRDSRGKNTTTERSALGDTEEVAWDSMKFTCPHCGDSHRPSDEHDCPMSKKTAVALRVLTKLEKKLIELAENENDNYTHSGILCSIDVLQSLKSELTDKG